MLSVLTISQSRLLSQDCVDLNVFQRGDPARDLTIKFEELSGVIGGWRDTAPMHT